MGNCAWFGAVSGDGLSREKERERERESVAVLYGRELDGGRRDTVWVFPHCFSQFIQTSV